MKDTKWLDDEIRAIYETVREKFGIPFYKIKLYVQYPNAVYAQTIHFIFVYIPNPKKDLGNTVVSREIQRRNYRLYSVSRNMKHFGENIYSKLEPYFLAPLQDELAFKKRIITATKQKYKFNKYACKYLNHLGNDDTYVKK